MTQDRIDTLNTVHHQLPQRDRDFAVSLLDQYARKGSLSDKQWPYVERLIATAKGGPREPAKVVAAGGLGAIHALFDKARKHLKHPAIVLAAPTSWTAATELRISIAGEQSRQPGSVFVKERGGPAYYGRVSLDGSFVPGRDLGHANAIEALRGVLTEFAADPAGVAARFGKLTGRCCFCNQALSDGRSTAVGYGETCAKNFGMPWGAKAAREAQAA